MIEGLIRKLKERHDERIILKQIEKDAYQREKVIVDADSINDKRMEAEQKGIDKAHTPSSTFSERLELASKKRKGNGLNLDDPLPPLITFGGKL